MNGEKRGGRGEAALTTAQDAADFALHRGRLERVVGAACDPGQPWPARVGAAIRAALVFAAVDPPAARSLAVHAASGRVEGDPSFAAMIDHFAALLNREAPSIARPESLAANIVARIARQVLLHLETRPDTPVTAIAPDLIVFALTPYTGFAEARRWAEDG